VIKELEDVFSSSDRPQGAPNEDQSIQGPLHVYRELRAKKRDEYAALSAHQRYALNNEYATFKKLWHDGMVGEEGPPLADASRWFDAQGDPVMPGLGDAAEDAEDSDDDIAVEREVISLICPITQQMMEEPYSNRKCKHTFEKAAILHHLGVSDPIQCPQTGCSQVMKRKPLSLTYYIIPSSASLGDQCSQRTS
jgi:E3 SUMO-protein ligase NSE2